MPVSASLTTTTTTTINNFFLLSTSILAPPPSQCSANDTATMMKRKFSLANIPLLNIGPSRLDTKQLRDQLLSPLESRPPTPRSVRPPLPVDLDNALRAACTYIVTHPKPSHELWIADAPRPALDYVAVKYDVEVPAGGAVRRPSTRSRGVAPAHDVPGDSVKYSYRPDVATEDLFRQDALELVPSQAHARSRADQLMTPEPVKPATNSRSARLQPPGQPDEQPHTQRREALDKNRMSMRSDSVGTTGSTPHTDSTDCPWSASTGMTSAVITPARGSKRASSQNVNSASETGSVPRVETLDADWMLIELEKHKRAMEERERERERERETGVAQRALNILPAEAETHASKLISRMPSRKPVPSRPESRQAREVSTTNDRPGYQARTNQDSLSLAHRGRSEGSRPATEPSNTGRGEQERSRSRLGRAASRAAIRVEGITNNIIAHYAKPSSTRDAQEQRDQTERKRSRSRVRHISTQIKDYIRPSRPGTSTSSRKDSMDTGRGHVRNGSMDSLRRPASQKAGEENTSRWKSWQPLRKGRTQASTPEMSRRGSSDSATREHNSATDQNDSLLKSKQPVDLNRELPPLPGLDQWKAEDEPPHHPQAIPASYSTAPHHPEPRRVVSRRHKDSSSAPSPNPSGLRIDAARVRSPERRLRQNTADAQRFDPGYSLQSSATSASPDLESPNLGSQRGAEPYSNAALFDAQKLRSKSSQGSRPELGTERNIASSSAASPANVHVFPVSRSTAATPVTGKRRPDMVNGHTGSSSNTNMAHTHARSHSDKLDNIRQQSVDDHHHIYQIPMTAPQQTSKEESRRKWWQGKEKSQRANWKNQAVHSGVVDASPVQDCDEAAGSPVVRF